MFVSRTTSAVSCRRALAACLHANANAFPSLSLPRFASSRTPTTPSPLLASSAPQTPRRSSRPNPSPNGPVIHSSKLHTLTKLPFDSKLGVPSFLSPAGLQTIRAHQQALVDDLNRITHGTPNEGSPVYTVMVNSHTARHDTHVFNVASQLWSTDFFLHKLGTGNAKMPDTVQAAICDTWGTLSSFQADFKSHAFKIFGCGWTWLVKDLDNRLLILNTYNAGTPLIPQRLQALDGNTDETTASFGTHDPEVAYPPPFPVKREELRAVANGTYVPLLCLNMWQHAYLQDYGLIARGEYVDNFWKAVDWTKVRV